MGGFLRDLQMQYINAFISWIRFVFRSSQREGPASRCGNLTALPGIVTRHRRVSHQQQAVGVLVIYGRRGGFAFFGHVSRDYLHPYS